MDATKPTGRPFQPAGTPSGKGADEKKNKENGNDSCVVILYIIIPYGRGPKNGVVSHIRWYEVLRVRCPKLEATVTMTV